MENINELKDEISVDIQQFIDEHLDAIRVHLTNDNEEFDPETVCAAFERANEDLELIKEKAEELAELWATQIEIEQVKNNDN